MPPRQNARLFFPCNFPVRQPPSHSRVLTWPRRPSSPPPPPPNLAQEISTSGRSSSRRLRPSLLEVVPRWGLRSKCDHRRPLGASGQGAEEGGQARGKGSQDVGEFGGVSPQLDPGELWSIFLCKVCLAFSRGAGLWTPLQSLGRGGQLPGRTWDSAGLSQGQRHLSLCSLGTWAGLHQSLRQPPRVVSVLFPLI